MPTPWGWQTRLTCLPRGESASHLLRGLQLVLALGDFDGGCRDNHPQGLNVQFEAVLSGDGSVLMQVIDHQHSHTHAAGWLPQPRPIA